MQILYVKIDEILGKGVGIDIMLELVTYAAVTLVPLSLPLAVLIASIMTMGKLGESYELVALRSAGVSLIRSMAALIVASIVMGIVAFFFSNTIMPYSKLKFNALMWDIKQKKSSLLIREGVFINDFENMTIRVEEKDEDLLRDVTIYDHRKVGQSSVIKADSARIIQNDSSNYLTMHLMNGKMHDDKNQKETYTRFAFDALDLVVDMSSFELGKTDEGLFKNNASLKTLRQIASDMDSLEQSLQNSYRSTEENIASQFKFIRPYITDTDETVAEKEDQVAPPPTAVNNQQPVQQSQVSNEEMQYNNAISRIKSIQQKIYSYERLAEANERNLVSHEIAWFQKFALALSCVILFFIGAPLGALVRKGGFGLPIVISILFYLLYYIIDLVGKHLAEQQALSPIIGIWLSSIVLIPVAIFLTRMALLDKKITPPQLPKLFGKK